MIFGIENQLRSKLKNGSDVMSLHYHAHGGDIYTYTQISEST